MILFIQKLEIYSFFLKLPKLPHFPLICIQQIGRIKQIISKFLQIWNCTSYWIAKKVLSLKIQRLSGIFKFKILNFNETCSYIYAHSFELQFFIYLLHFPTSFLFSSQKYENSRFYQLSLNLQPSIVFNKPSSESFRISFIVTRPVL